MSSNVIINELNLKETKDDYHWNLLLKQIDNWLERVFVIMIDMIDNLWRLIDWRLIIVGIC